MLESSKSLGWPSRLVVIVAGVLFLPAMSDLLLGNVTIVLTALALIAIRTDRIGAGVAFGVALAAVPKPLFIPLLLWMVAYRRQSLTGTIAGGLAASVVGVLILGVDRYVDFFTALSTGAGIPTDFVGNLGLSAISPAVGILGNVAAIAAVVAAIAFLSVESALVVASLAGVFMGTYAGLYSALPLLISLPILAASHRRRALAIGGLSLGIHLRHAAGRGSIDGGRGGTTPRSLPARGIAGIAPGVDATVGVTRARGPTADSRGQTIGRRRAASACPTNRSVRTVDGGASASDSPGRSS